MSSSVYVRRFVYVGGWVLPFIYLQEHLLTALLVLACLSEELQKDGKEGRKEGEREEVFLTNFLQLDEEEKLVFKSLLDRTTIGPPGRCPGWSGRTNEALPRLFL